MKTSDCLNRYAFITLSNTSFRPSVTIIRRFAADHPSSRREYNLRDVSDASLKRLADMLNIHGWDMVTTLEDDLTFYTLHYSYFRIQERIAT